MNKFSRRCLRRSRLDCDPHRKIPSRTFLSGTTSSSEEEFRPAAVLECGRISLTTRSFDRIALSEAEGNIGSKIRSPSRQRHTALLIESPELATQFSETTFLRSLDQLPKTLPKDREPNLSAPLSPQEVQAARERSRIKTNPWLLTQLGSPVRSPCCSSSASGDSGAWTATSSDRSGRSGQGSVLGSSRDHGQSSHPGQTSHVGFHDGVAHDW